MPIRSWTDDLPKCQATGIGNYLRGVDNGCSELNEPFTFSCRIEGDTFLYGIIDPHNGTNSARFALQRMAAEILFGQLSNKSSDEEIKEVLRNAFLSVEKDYIESIDGVVAERTSLQYHLPDGGINTEDISKYRDILTRLKSIDQHLSIGATAVVALVHNGKLYVANVGESRALLCKTDENSVLRVVQLSIDHGLSNEDELLRLSHLGLDVNKLKNTNVLGNQKSTRCLGNYLVKGLYKAFPEMHPASSEPVIGIPEITGPLILDESCRFLILMSAGVYKRLEEATNTDQVNKQLAQMTVERLRSKSSLTEVCQSVIEQIVLLHDQQCSLNQKQNQRDSTMTLLIRNFNYPMPNVVTATLLVQGSNPTKSEPQSKQKVQNTPAVRFNPIVQSHSHPMLNEGSDTDTYTNNSENADVNKPDYTDSNPPEAASENSNFRDSSSATDTSSDLYSNGSRVMYDKNRRIKAYVDFAPYFENVEIAKNNGTLPAFMRTNN